MQGEGCEEGGEEGGEAFFCDDDDDDDDDESGNTRLITCITGAGKAVVFWPPPCRVSV